MLIPPNLPAHFRIAQISYQKGLTIEAAVEEHNGIFLTFINDCAKILIKDFDLFEDDIKGAKKLTEAMKDAFWEESKKILKSKDGKSYSPPFTLENQQGQKLTFRYVEKDNTITLEKINKGKDSFNPVIFSRESSISLEKIMAIIKADKAISEELHDYPEAMKAFSYL